jgi:hypothetical protein
VVTVADDALFGQDGTQPPPPPPLLGDALAGLVTGYLFSDTTIAAPDETHWKQEALPPARVEVRRARPVAARRVAVTPPSGSVTPAQFAVAAPLPSRLPAEKRPTVPRTTPVKPAPPARANQRKTIGSQAPTKRSGGAGCAIFLIMVLVIIGVFVVLGVLLGHGDAGLSGGGGGG